MSLPITTRLKKMSLAMLVFLTFFTTVAGSFSWVEPARAQAQVGIFANLPENIKQVIDQIWEGLKAAVLQAAGRLIAYGLRKISYDAAVWLASGGKGQSPFSHTKGFGDYLQNVGDAAFGDVVESFGKSLGFKNGLCQIPDIKLDLALKVGLRGGAGGGPGAVDENIKSKCSFSDFKKNWSGDAWQSKYNQLGQTVGDQFNQALTSGTDDSDIGTQLGRIALIDKTVAAKAQAALLQRQEGGGFIGKGPVIAGETGGKGMITTPAALQAEGFKGVTPDKQAARDQTSLEAYISQGNIRVIPSILGIFLSNLGSAVVKNFQEKGMLPFGLGCVGGGDKCLGDGNAANNADSAGFAIGGRAEAQELFSEFLNVTKSITSVDKYDLLGDLGNCDGNGVYNCRADPGLIQAVQQSNAGQPLTIGEALKKGNLLHPDWQLIPPSRLAENMDKVFCARAYCNSNIKVLRLARIVPLGFQIATELSDPDKPWTLDAVVKGFNDCSHDKNGQVIFDNAKPFCHLIDPNWILKIPPTQCNALVYGPSPLGPGLPERAKECADLTSCVAYNNDGSCKNYAYCAREKNEWKFTAQSCSAEFATCRAFQDSTGQKVAYLARTLDTGFCNQETVGCRAYSFNQNSKGEWLSLTPPGTVNSFDATQNNFSPGIHFNSQLSVTSCTSNAAGCSAFTVAANNDTLYLRRAPDYLKCYDSQPNTPAVDWPQTFSDLSKIKPRTECTNYARACIADEVNCSWYTPVGGDTASRLPGKYKPRDAKGWNDECDASCVGYAAYREMPSTYSNGQPIVSIIPPSATHPAGKTCSLTEAGCSSFTNLSATNNGLEQVDYYSYLRPCVTPSKDKGKNFITYEGQAIGGHQIKTFLLSANQGDLSNGPDGSPKYFYKDLEELKQFNKDCSAGTYNSGQASLDCRQFNDDAGVVYYRMLSHTIPVSSVCTPYRLNNNETYTVAAGAAMDNNICVSQKGVWEQNNNLCRLCFQNGAYKNGACYYDGLPANIENSAGISQTCSAAVDTCRGYKGNGGNNIRTVFNDTFEQGPIASLTSWGPTVDISVAAASTHEGEHSLTYLGDQGPERKVVLTIGKSYDLTFWAKGSTQALQVGLKDGVSKELHPFETVGVGDAWKFYHLGPVEINNAATTTFFLFFVRPEKLKGQLFLDNVRLLEAQDNIYLVKKSLTVDLVCNSHPFDNLPGEALGCTAYKDISNNTLYLTNFSYLCREGAIGCTAVFETFNYDIKITTSGPRAYNVWLTGAAGQKIIKKIGVDSYDCDVPIGRVGCYVTQVNGHTLEEITKELGSSAITTSTVYLPAHSPTVSPVYLVADKAAACNQTDVGCMVAGVEQKTPRGSVFTNTVIKNNPEDPAFTKTMCQEEAVGCMKFTGGTGGAVYFKDPSVIGQKICTYRGNAVTLGGAAKVGWFWKGVGVCANKQGQKKLPTQYCGQDQDCGGTDQCQGIDEQACYPDYIQSGIGYGLWSYGNTTAYRNFVGECPANQDTCTEFLDHNDAKVANQPRTYYLLKNKDLTEGDCGGMVSQKKGCILLDQTDITSKYYVTSDVYKLSELKDSQPVKPEVVTSPLADANIIVKVQPNRECGEWLQCRSSHRVFDTNTNKYKNVCDAVGRCDAVSNSLSKNGSTECSHWVDQGPYANQVLTSQLYVTRDTSWKGMDFAGFSILNSFPVEELSEVDTNASTLDNVVNPPQWRLLKEIPCGGNNCTKTASESACVGQKITDCKQIFLDSPWICPPLPTCGKSNEGACLAGTCVQGSNGTTSQIVESSVPQSCRAYPEKDAPFPSTPSVMSKSRLFDKVNYCQESATPSNAVNIGYSCECDYTKATYGDSITKYWNYQSPIHIDPFTVSRKGVVETLPVNIGGKLPFGICLGGRQDGRGCRDDYDCVNDSSSIAPDGVCQKNKKNSKLVGWRGFCLEEDQSRVLNGDQNSHACLSWYPVDALNGTMDIENQHREAGYENPSTGGTYYCLNSNGGGSGTDKYFSVDPSDPQYGYLRRSGEVTAGKSKLIYRRFALKPGQADADRKIRQSDIEKIIFTVRNPDTVDPAAGTSFEIWPNDPTAQQAAYEVITNGGSKEVPRGFAVTGHYLGRKNELILFYGSDIDVTKGSGSYVDAVGKVCNPGRNKDKTDLSECQGLSGNIFKSINFNAHYPDGPEGKFFYKMIVDGDKNTGDGIWANMDAPVETWPIDKMLMALTEPQRITLQACYQGNLEKKQDAGNWNAVRVKFDPQSGVLQGYDLAYCHNSGGGDGGITYDVTIVMREYCTIIADASVDYGIKATIPWTNRLWKNRNNFFTINGLKSDFTTDFAPFGSLKIASPSQGPAIVLTPPFKFPAQKNSSKTCEPGQNNCTCPSGGGPVACTYYVQPTPIQSGAPFSCGDNGGYCVKSTTDTSKPIASSLARDFKTNVGQPNGLTNLGELFASVATFFYWDFTADTKGYQPKTFSALNNLYYNNTEQGDLNNKTGKPKPPKIYPTGKCDNNDVCLEDTSAEGIAVNGVSNGDYKLLDSSGKATVGFFAFADNNQMPINSIAVDWDDGSGSKQLKGQFRNHRGLAKPTCTNGLCVIGGDPAFFPKINGTIVACKENNDCQVTSRCVDETEAITFGMIKNKTCDNDYYQFDHNYSCKISKEMRYHYESDSKLCGDKELFKDGCCIYKPKAQVKDNWGWCNGSCSKHWPGSDVKGCYDGKNNPFSNFKENECISTKEAWTNQAVRVIVSPK